MKKLKLFATAMLITMVSGFTNIYSAYLPWPMFMGNPQRTGLFIPTIGERGTMDSVTVKWKSNVSSLTSAAIGNIDTDAEVEVVVGGTDGKVYALKGVDGTVKWSYSLGGIISTYGSSPAIGDIDGDSAIEIVIGAQNGKVYAIEGNGSTLLWSRTVRDEISSAPVIGDVDGNSSTIEVVVGTKDSTKCLNGADGTVLWATPTGLPAGSDIYSSPAIGNIDTNTATIEVVVACNDTSVYALNGIGGTVLWKAKTEAMGGGGTPPMLIFTPAIKDIDGDGTIEVVAYHIQGIYCFNGTTGAQKWKNNGYGTLSGTGVNEATALADIDNDGRLEVLMRSGGVRALDEYAGTQLWSYVFPTHSNVGCNPVVADVEGDGLLEVIDANHVGWIACLEGEDRTVKWTFDVTSNDIHPTHGIGDIDGDGCIEIVGTGMYGPIYAIESPCPTAVEETGKTTDDINIKFARSKNRLIVMFNLCKNANPKVTIFDICGREKKQVVIGNLTVGHYETSIDISSFNNGTYFARINLGDKILTKKLILIR